MRMTSGVSAGDVVIMMEILSVNPVITDGNADGLCSGLALHLGVDHADHVVDGARSDAPFDAQFATERAIRQSSQHLAFAGAEWVRRSSGHVGFLSCSLRCHLRWRCR